MEDINASVSILAVAAVAGALVLFMTLNLPLIGNFDNFKYKGLMDLKGWARFHWAMFGLTWIVRWGVMVLMWLTWAFYLDYKNAAFMLESGSSTNLNATYEEMNFVTYQAVWFTTICTMILFYKFTSESYYHMKQKGVLVNTLRELAGKAKEVVESKEDAKQTMIARDLLKKITFGFPFLNERMGIWAPLAQAIIALLFLIPLATNVAYGWGIFRDQSRLGYDTPNAPDQSYRIMYTIFATFTMAGVGFYAFLQLMSAGGMCMRGETAESRGDGVAFENVFYLTNLDFSKITDNAIPGLFAWRGSRHSPESTVDGVEHTDIYGLGEGAIMQVSVSYWLLFLYALQFDYTAYLVLRNNERWIGFVITTNIVPLLFARVSKDSSSSFFEFFNWCQAAFWLNYVAFYGWNYHLGVAGWEPAQGLGCPSGEERYCFYSIPFYRTYAANAPLWEAGTTELTYEQMTPILVGLGIFMAVLVVMQVVMFAVFFLYDGEYKGKTFDEKIRKVNHRLGLAKIKPQ